MKRAIFTAIFIFTFFSFFMISNNFVFAKDTLRDILAKKYQSEKDICNVVKEAITEGMNTRDVTRTSIQMGNDACLVIKCAIEAEGNLEQIINGALEAGTTSDVSSRCAIDAGADAIEVARIFETGLGYSPPLAAVLTPIEIGLPGGNPAGGVISPWTF
jgi:hypothetical protein